MRAGLESDELSEMELEDELVSAGGTGQKRAAGTLTVVGGAVSPEAAKYLVVLLAGWLSVRGLEIGCGGGIASVYQTAQPTPVLYVATEADHAPVSAFIAGSDLSFGGRAVESARRSFTPVHFPVVPLSALVLTNLQPISVVQILAPTVPLPPAPPTPPGKVGVPEAPRALRIQ